MEVSEELLKRVRAQELDSLISALGGGMRIMPSDLVRQTTILVTPGTWQALKDRIQQDTAAEREEKA